MAKKSSTTRKGLAIGLAVVGIAGLSLASAAQLNMTSPGTLQAGAVSVSADCQSGPITVKFATPAISAGQYRSASIELTGIEPGCSGKNYKVSILDGAVPAAPVITEIGKPLPTIAAATTGTISVPIAALDANQISSIKSIALTIYS